MVMAVTQWLREAELGPKCAHASGYCRAGQG